VNEIGGRAGGLRPFWQVCVFAESNIRKSRIYFEQGRGEMKRAFLLVSTATIVALSPILMQPVLAQAAAASDENATDNSEEIIVTGSHIRGAAKDTALPVAIIDSADIAKRGSPSMLELIKTLPLAGPVFGEVNQFNAASARQTGAGSVNLRGLGGARTLILLNGRRVVSAPGLNSGGPNTELFPVSAIGRVEVLKDGAAATIKRFPGPKEITRRAEFLAGTASGSTSSCLLAISIDPSFRRLSAIMQCSITLPIQRAFQRQAILERTGFAMARPIWVGRFWTQTVCNWEAS
jgi:TonB-dependent Receptor Plug Domain